MEKRNGTVGLIMTDYKEFAKQMREHSVKTEFGNIICQPELWEEIASIIERAIIGDTADLINRLQAENERLKPFEDKIAEFKSHIRVEDMLVFASSLEEWLEFCNNLKAEAYKEFAERFKKKLSQKYTTSLWKVYCEEIDNLLKDLIGE